MQKRNQIIAVVAVALIMGYLAFQPIGVLRNDDSDNVSSEVDDAGPSVNYQTESQRAKQGILPVLVQEIEDLENQREKASTDDAKIAYLKSLSAKWDDINKKSPLGYIYEQLGQLDNQFEYWFNAGEAFREAYGSIQDETISSALKLKAIEAYNKAVEIDPENLDAKTGLGSALVSGSENPMAGIALLQEVVEKNPDHLEANKSLGLFSMQSRQFDKAITRFQKVLSIEPDAESYFYIATSYENIGLKKEAVAAFQKSKELSSDPTLAQFIDRKIEELSK